MRVLSFFLIPIFLLCSASLSMADETIRIAAIFAKTGKAAFKNTPFNGVRMAVKEINQQGGIMGRPIELFEIDNQSTALGSKIAAQKAVKTNVIAVIGASWSSHSQAIAQVCQAEKIPMISPYSTNPQVTRVGDFIFRVCYIDPFQGAVMASFSLRHLNAKTAGIFINADSKYSEGLAKYFADHYRNQGGEILFEGNYLDKATDFVFLVDKIKLFNPDVVFIPGYDKDSAYIIKQSRNNGLSTTFVGGDGWSDDMYGLVGKAIEGSYYSSHWHADIPNKKSRHFVENFKAYSTDMDIGSALSYDCVWLFSDAVVRAGSFDPVKIRDAIAATQRYPGVTGEITFDSNGDPIKPAVILMFDKGRSVYVNTIKP